MRPTRKPSTRIGLSAALLTLLLALPVLLALTASSALAAPPEPPETTPATAVTAATAIAHGVLDSNAPSPELLVEYGFFYAGHGAACNQAFFAPETPGLASGAEGEAVELGLTGLEANTEYVVCVADRNIGEETWSLGSQETFKTEALKPDVKTESASSVKAAEARLEATVNPENDTTECHFQYGEALVSEHEVECEQGNALNGGEQGVGVSISGLTQTTSYHYRVLLKNATGETEGDEETFTTALPPETPETTPATEITATTATLNGTLNPKAPGEPGSYEFLYRRSPSECQGEGEKITEPSEPSAGSDPEPVSAPVTELLPHTTYTFCLRAHNRAEAAEAATGPPVSFTTLVNAPTIQEASVSNVAASSATFSATINPQGAETSYTFELAPSGGSFTPVLEPEGKGSLPEGVTGVPLSVHVAQGLLPNASYEFRLVAKNSAAPQGVVGEAVSFTTQTPGGELVLPDGRQYEMVTPPDKHGASFFGLNARENQAVPFVAQASAAGSAIIDLASQPTEAQPQGNTNEISILSTRDPAGWSSQVIAPPHAQGTSVSVGEGAEYRLFSEDLSLGVVHHFGNFTPLSPDASESTPYLHTDYLNGNVSEHCSSSCFQALVTRANTQQGAVFGEAVHGECENFICGPKFLAATADLGHVVLTTGVQLTPIANEPSTFGNRFYEWGDGQLQPLYLLPKSEGAVGVAAGRPEGEGPFQGELADHQLSEDGSLFFTHHGHLYLHDFSKGESARLDGEEPGEGEAAFLYASSDGSSVLFTDPRQLTSAPGGGVYECRIRELSCELELTGLSGRPYSIEGEQLAIGSLLGGSRDASYLYFIGAGEKLIVAHYEGGQWTTSEGPVIPQSNASGFLPFGGRVTYERALELATYRISPNGRFIAFNSDRRLTGYDNRDALSGQPDEEVYLYEAASNRLVCASCNPTGARPVGTESNPSQLVAGEFAGNDVWVAADVPPWERSTGLTRNGELYQPRYLSDSGRLFFDSHDALVPQDVNGTQDVYQYEPLGVPAGEHACGEQSATFGARSGGCLSLISRGDSPEESAFLDASQSSADVFFLTTSKLSPQDNDTARDVYDAHECTSASPCIAPPPPPPTPCDSETSCKASQTPQPDIFGTPASGTFSGPGNLRPEPPAPPKPKTAAQIRAEKLAKALKACHKDKKKNKRHACEKQARKKYGAAKKAKKARKSSRAKKATDNRRAS